MNILIIFIVTYLITRFITNKIRRLSSSGLYSAKQKYYVNDASTGVYMLFYIDIQYKYKLFDKHPNLRGQCLYATPYVQTLAIL